MLVRWLSTDAVRHRLKLEQVTDGLVGVHSAWHRTDPFEEDGRLHQRDSGDMRAAPRQKRLARRWRDYAAVRR